MLISVNWLRDFVDLPAKLDPAELGERFTTRCAEVEGVEPIHVGAQGLIAAGVLEVTDLPGTPDLRRVKLDVGGAKTVETLSQAPSLTPGQSVIYAPPGAKIAALGQIGQAKVAGHTSTGMIPPADALGIALAAKEAVFLDPQADEGKPGSKLPADMFDDWVIEVDNKSITHRPDLWGHYGIAREVAAMFTLPLKPYPVTQIDILAGLDAPELPIEIDDPQACPRYSALVMRNLDTQPSPLWMQLRLGHVGLRPIDCMVDLTNYIMLELGQPMHAFDGDKVDRIEVGLAKPGSKFTTLDGLERTLPPGALMIQSQRKPVALAGIMGGADTEIGPQTKSVLLESANFHPAVIRRCAAALGHRTDASARFEKSLDPANTVLGIQRFVQLAKTVWPQMSFASKLSDCYPQPAAPVSVQIDPAFVNRFMGQAVTPDQIRELLTPLGFTIDQTGDKLTVAVPGFRATKDVAIEADVIEEIARCVGYNNIEPALPDVAVRSVPPSAAHELEQNSLRLWCLGLGYTEIHGYIWDDADWCRRLGFDPGPCIELRNPVADGQHRLRPSLMPGLLAALEKNRHHLAEFKLIELGSVFEPDHNQHRRLAVLSAKRQKGAEDALLAELRGAVETWAWQILDTPARFGRIESNTFKPWQHQQKTAQVTIGDTPCGTVSVAPLALRRAIDDHLAPWSVAWAEIDLDSLIDPPPVRALHDIPEYPQKDLDFTAVVQAENTYQEVSARIARFEHPLLLRITFVASYEGKSLGAGKRSLTVRAKIGAADRTLVEDDLIAFGQAFERHLASIGLQLRGAG